MNDYIVFIVASDGYQNAVAFRTNDLTRASKYIKKSSEKYSKQIGAYENTFIKKHDYNGSNYIERYIVIKDKKYIFCYIIPDFVSNGIALSINVFSNGDYECLYKQEDNKRISIVWSGRLFIRELSDDTYDHLKETSWRVGEWYVVIHDSEGDTPWLIRRVQSECAGHRYLLNTFNNIIDQIHNVYDNKNVVECSFNRNDVVKELIEEFVIRYRNGIVFYARLYHIIINDYAINHSGRDYKYLAAIISSNGKLLIRKAERPAKCRYLLKNMWDEIVSQNGDVDVSYNDIDDVIEPQAYIKYTYDRSEIFGGAFIIQDVESDYYDPSKKYKTFTYK